uniref:Deoxyribodipyrimidine photo-lyase n=1 Tax=Polytomella parva TaxID=51329 RepID=A0A7S0UNI1_9CHLO|mmetsp:Transcript_15369/g.27376  ORF Transcript_15369/g.27376 Transcript_15369/m.27376 type:complete len:789 (+) Transcript_15369:517-2883(+)|eukprot:CAMPEP_0175062064 /NCGR_PEP_ID=MMETSP0052_2-20121109/13945_1 /TAXON_ID=51329 ORGANISM="Polytomella parva, Strain SAG 63-3" /NCGR_SAMPLE_ID=MMETSP0052_2 /ASSEMBLY_ACC=CAM_ASM_000194 /LENGTH=788 /DNA_ID=CAMNT_0016328013 /DNA_START=446 /DNA_END=2815 /DNA_ORIENTATION=-
MKSSKSSNSKNGILPIKSPFNQKETPENGSILSFFRRVGSDFEADETKSSNSDANAKSNAANDGSSVTLQKVSLDQEGEAQDNVFANFKDVTENVASSSRRLFEVFQDPTSVFRTSRLFRPMVAGGRVEGNSKTSDDIDSKVIGNRKDSTSYDNNIGQRTMLVHPARIRVVKPLDYSPDTPDNGPVIYMMFRDQRVKDNWALLHAAEEANRRGVPLAVVFTALPSLLCAGARQYDFMLRGLAEVALDLETLGIPFFFNRGYPPERTSWLTRQANASLLVCDYSPIRVFHQWIEQMMALPVSSSPLSISSSTVTKNYHVSSEIRIIDAHNVVPVWSASEKREIGARTIRSKIHRALPEFMHEFPEVPELTGGDWDLDLVQPDPINWRRVLKDYHERGRVVPPVHWLTPGESAGRAALLDPKDGFLTDRRIKAYDTLRNNPSCDAVSNLSPYFHFGQLAPQRAALEASKRRKTHPAAIDSFLEELVVRRELADNFCHYSIDSYDSLESAAGWARETLEKHRSDAREHLYSKAVLEEGRTADELWNACQLQMTKLGKMHGFMRMYWAKKVLEWTQSPEDAIKILIELNDKYEIDGRDPNGYVGIMWSVAGVHDQGWGERAVFGKIRYMNYAGCKRKFNIPSYCAAVYKAIAQEEKAAAAARAAKAVPGVEGNKEEIWSFNPAKKKNIASGRMIKMEPTGKEEETVENGVEKRGKETEDKMKGSQYIKKEEEEVEVQDKMIGAIKKSEVIQEPRKKKAKKEKDRSDKEEEGEEGEREGISNRNLRTKRAKKE